MPTLVLRSVGMSTVLEGLGPSGLDAEALLDDLALEYGQAVAALGTSRTPDSSPDPDESAIDSLIIDRKAATRDALRERLLAWVVARGARYASWAEDGLAADGSSTLHFHM